MKRALRASCAVLGVSDGTVPVGDSAVKGRRAGKLERICPRLVKGVGIPSDTFFVKPLPKMFLLPGLFLFAGSVLAAARPNVLVILADDMGCGDVRAFNMESKIPTPHMDRLAAQGLVFRDAHSASSIGGVARYGLMTGRYCWRNDPSFHEAMGFDPPLVSQDRFTLGDLFKQSGYRTAYFGNWGLGLGWVSREGGTGSWERGYTGTGETLGIDFSKPVLGGPNTLGFDYFFGTAASLDRPPYAFIENDSTIGIPDKVTRAGGRKGLTVEGFRAIDALPGLTRKAVQYLQRQAASPSGEPFFLFVSLTAPHTPFVPTEQVSGRSQAGRYGDSVALADWSVGRLLNALEKTGLVRDTLVLLTSDNGSMKSNDEMEPAYGHRPGHLYRGRKGDPWEGGHRVPLIVQWPRKLQPGTTHEVVCQTDLLATFADILGAALPADAGEDSFSFLPVLQGKVLEKPVRESIIHYAAYGSFAIREGKWKLILPPEHPVPRAIQAPTAGQLYDLESDIGETRNLWEQHPARVDRLRKLLEKYRAQKGSKGDS